MLVDDGILLVEALSDLNQPVPGGKLLLAEDHQGEEECTEAHHGNEQDGEHDRFRVGGSRVNSTKKASCEQYQRYLKCSDDCQDGSDSGSVMRVFQRVTDDQVARVD